jgi:hypothetical protein
MKEERFFHVKKLANGRIMKEAIEILEKDIYGDIAPEKMTLVKFRDGTKFPVFQRHIMRGE